MFKNIPSHGETPDLGPAAGPLDQGKPEYVEGMKDVSISRSFDVGKKWRNPYLLNPQEYTDHEQLYESFMHWWTQRYRRNKNTAIDYIRDLRRMNNDPVLPIDFLRFDPQQIITHLDYYEQQNKDRPYAIINKWKAIRAVGRAYGINVEAWGYKPPSAPPPKVRIIPLPPKVHRLTLYKYYNDKYRNAFIRHFLYHGFLLGLRPSEMAILKTTDIHYDEGYIIIKEPKKGNQLRQIFPEKEILKDPHRKSLYTWEHHWRKKVANEQSKDFFYLQKNGKPYKINRLRKIINEAVKPLVPYFSLYTMRHWCAIARLIKTKVETGNFDAWEVKDWLGHDKIDTTDSYIRYAKKYYNQASYDWIKTLLKFYKNKHIEQQKGKYKKDTIETNVEKIETYLKRPLFRVELTGVARDGPGRAHFQFLLLFCSIKNRIFGFLNFQHLSLPFSLFFYKNNCIVGVAS